MDLPQRAPLRVGVPVLPAVPTVGRGRLVTRTGAYADADIRTRLHALDHEHAMRHGAALAEGITAKGVRVYFPGEAGYLSVGPDGSVSEVSGRYRTFAESALDPAWKRAV